MGSINFPNLGIHLNNVGKSLDIFGLEIAYYGLIIGCGVIGAIFLATILAKKSGIAVDTIYDLAIYLLASAIVGARLYYVIFSWDYYKDNLWKIFNIREGGLALYGGVIGAVIATIVYAKIKKISFWQLIDIGSTGLIVGQIVGRWGNFFNREAFGEYTDSLFAMQLPLEAVRRGDVTAKMLEHQEVIDGITYIQVHPTFLYEATWNLVWLVILLVAWKYKKFDGQIFLMYLFGYGLGRFFIEGLRTDPLMIAHTDLRVSQVLALVLVITAPILFFIKMRKKVVDK